jgi:hypothetical protein
MRDEHDVGRERPPLPPPGGGPGPPRRGTAPDHEAQKAEHDRLKAEGVICSWVFNRSNRKVKGKRITTFIKAFRAACTKAGCPGRILHDLRRTAVRNLVRAGIPERVAMQMTGHKTRSVFERYNIESECDLVEAAKKLSALQPAALPPEGGSHTSDRDGLASTKPQRRSRAQSGHNRARSRVPPASQSLDFLRNFGGAARI